MQKKTNITLPLAVLSLAMSMAVSAKTELRGNIESSSVAIRQTSDAGLDRIGVVDVTPTFELVHSGSVLKTTASVSAHGLWYKDSVREDESYLSYRLTNQAKFLNDALTLTANTTQDQRVVGTGGRLNRGLDEYNSPDLLSKFRTSQAGASYTFDRSTWLQASANVNVYDSRSSAAGVTFNTDPLDPSSLAALDNQTVSYNSSISTMDRNRPFFWGVDITGNNTKRKQFDNLRHQSIFAIAGVPFIGDIKMVGQARFEDSSGNEVANSDLLSGYQNSRSIGGGLEWAIGQQSFWNVTYNTIRNDQGEKHYLGTRFQLKPTRRTSISGNLDRRFYGRSMELSGEYNLKHLRVKLTGTEQVGSLLALSGLDNSTGLFVCPPGAVPSLDNCYQPPELNYIPQPGETYYNITIPGDDYSEFGVVRRSLSLDVGYSFKRLNVSSNVGERRDTYLGRDAVRKERFASMGLSWALSQRSDVALNFNHSNQIDAGAASDPSLSFAGISNNWQLAYNRQLNKRLNSSLSYSRINNDFANDAYRFEENRLMLTLRYQFGHSN